MILDIIVMALLVLSMYLGYKQGLVKLVIKLIALIISVVVALFLFNPVANFIIDNTQIDETLENKIYETEIKIVEEKAEENKELINLIQSKIQDGTLQVTSRNIAINVVKVGVFILLLIIVRIAMIFITKLLSSISDLPILKQFNKMGGIVYGALRGFLIVFILLILIQLYTQIDPTNQAYAVISESYFTRGLYENNFLNYFIKV